MNLIRKTILATSLALATTAISAKENKANLQLADSYLEAYKVFDIDKMATFYADESVFIDPTSELFGEGKNYHMQGKGKVVSKLNELIKSVGAMKLDYRMKSKFEAAGYVVYQANVKVTSGLDEKVTTGCADITTIITINDGKVSEHRDYFDYNAFMTTYKKGDQQCAA